MLLPVNYRKKSQLILNRLITADTQMKLTKSLPWARTAPDKRKNFSATSPLTPHTLNSQKHKTYKKRILKKKKKGKEI